VLVVGAAGGPSGLSGGDVILRVGTEPVANPSDVNALIATARENGQSTVVFYVARSSGRRFIAVPLP
jgi:S1-C subfamily serine protease